MHTKLSDFFYNNKKKTNVIILQETCLKYIFLNTEKHKKILVEQKYLC